MYFLRKGNNWKDPIRGDRGFYPDFRARIEQERRVLGTNTLIKVRDKVRVTFSEPKNRDQLLLQKQIITHDHTRKAA